MRSLRPAMKSSPRLPQLEKVHAKQRRPSAAKNKNEKRHLTAVHKTNCQKYNNIDSIKNFEFLKFVCVCVCVCVLSCVHLFATPWTSRLLCPWDFPGRSTGEGCHFLLQGTFPMQGLNHCLLCLLHGRQIRYHCCHLR